MRSVNWSVTISIALERFDLIMLIVRVRNYSRRLFRIGWIVMNSLCSWGFYSWRNAAHSLQTHVCHDHRTQRWTYTSSSKPVYSLYTNQPKITPSKTIEAFHILYSQLEIYEKQQVWWPLRKRKLSMGITQIYVGIRYLLHDCHTSKHNDRNLWKLWKENHTRRVTKAQIHASFQQDLRNCKKWANSQRAIAFFTPFAFHESILTHQYHFWLRADSSLGFETSSCHRFLMGFQERELFRAIAPNKTSSNPNWRSNPPAETSNLNMSKTRLKPQRVRFLVPNSDDEMRQASPHPKCLNH